MSSHIPTFAHPTDWDDSRTSPTQAACPCGWTSDTLPDQTLAELEHGRHLVREGVYPAETFADDLTTYREDQP